LHILLGRVRFIFLNKKDDAPSPQKYTLPQTLSNKSYSFGISREKFKKVFLKENPTQDPLIPGPGTYSPTQEGTFTIVDKTKGFTLKPRLNDSTTAFYSRNSQFPGPGSYEERESIDNGKAGFYVSSRYRNPGCMLMNSQGARFKSFHLKKESLLPGPGQYD